MYQTIHFNNMTYTASYGVSIVIMEHYGRIITRSHCTGADT